MVFVVKGRGDLSRQRQLSPGRCLPMPASISASSSGSFPITAGGGTHLPRGRRRRCSPPPCWSFLFAYLNLNRWHVRYSPRQQSSGSIFLAALVGLAVIDPPVASGRGAHLDRGGLRRIGLLLDGASRHPRLRPGGDADPHLAAAGGLGHGCTAFAVTGQLGNGPRASPPSIGGLVLIVMLIGFTVMQHAFTAQRWSPPAT